MSLRGLARRAIVATSLPEVMLRYRARRHVAVLGYHRILTPADADYAFNEAVISATPEEFARELSFLRSNLDVISMPQLLEGLLNPQLLPERPAVITFDDGYWDNHRFAFPLLREAGLPACFFVCTGLIGTREIPWHEAWVCCLKRSRERRIESPFGPNDPPYELDDARLARSIARFRGQMRKVPWSQMPEHLERIRQMTQVNPEEYLSQPMFMSWDDVRELDAAGMSIGGHTRSHPILSWVDNAAMLRDEINGCYQDLARELGRPPLAFAYPVGSADAMSESADTEIQQAGFKMSFSFVHGFVPRGTQALVRLPRIHASHGDDYQSFRFRTATAPAVA